MTFVQGVGLSFSFTAAAAVTCADITRFQKNRKETVKSVFWGVMPAGIFTLCLGVLITKATGDYDITTVLASVGLPIIDGDPAGRSVPELQHSSFWISF